MTSDRRHLSANILFIYGSFAFRTITPFVVIPFISRLLGPSGYGAVLLGVAVSTVVSLVVEFGFPSSAPREIVIASQKGNLQEVVSRVVGAKLLLSLLAGILGLTVVSQVPFLQKFGEFSRWGIYLGIASGLNTNWYFQGRGKLWISASLDGANSLAAAALMIILIRSPQYAILFLQIQAGTAATTVLIAHYIIARDAGIKMAPWRDVTRTMHSATTLFAIRAATAVYTSASVLALGALSSSYEVGIYAAGEKLIVMCLAAFSPLTQAVFPLIARRFAEGQEQGAYAIIRNLLLGVAGLGSVSVLGALLLGSLIIKTVYGASFLPAAQVFAILAWLIPCGCANQVLAGQLLVPLKRERLIVFSVIAGAITNVLFALILAPRFGAVGMAASRALSEVSVLAVLIFGVARMGLLQKVFAAVSAPGVEAARQA